LTLLLWSALLFSPIEFTIRQAARKKAAETQSFHSLRLFRGAAAIFLYAEDVSSLRIPSAWINRLPHLVVEASLRESKFVRASAVLS